MCKQQQAQNLGASFYDKLVQKFKRNKLIQFILNWMKTHSFPGFHKTPIWDIFVFIWYEIQRDDLFLRAQAISFSFFLSLFPALIALFTMLPLFFGLVPSMEQGLSQVLQQEIQSLMPGGAGEKLFEFIDNILTTPRFALQSFGFVLAIFFSSNGMVTLMKGFEKSYEEVFKQRTLVKKQLVAIGLIFVLFFLLLMSVVFIITGDYILTWLTSTFNIPLEISVGLYIIRWLGILFIFYVGIAFIYRYGASTHRRFSFSSPGTTVAAISCILISVIFSFYVDNFGAYNTFYGSIGALIVIMLWIQFNVLVLLVGFELNVSIAVHRDLKEPLPSEEESAQIEPADLQENK